MLYLNNLLQKYKFKYIFLKSFLISTIIFLLMSSNLVTLLKDSIEKNPSLKDFKFYNVVSNIDEILFICALVLLILYAVTKGIMNKIWRDMLSDKICYLDKIIFTIFSIELLFFIFLLKLTIDDTIIKHLVLIFIMITILLFECRIFLYNGQFLTYRKDQDINNLENYIKTESNVIKNKPSTLITLQDLIDNNVHGNELVLLEEQAIESENENLIDNQNFISGFEKILLNCSPKESYVFGLLGKWGSGKTSIINILKKRINNNSDTKIEIFSPWKYDDKKSLFAGFYDFIARNVGISETKRKSKKLYKKYKKIIFGVVEKKLGFSIEEVFSKSDKDILEEMKEDINKHIRISDKKLIIVIDDIDRLNKEQILFLFNIINNVFNFDNLVYILCFDEQVILRLLEKEIPYDKNYLDKIIQNKITMPNIETNSIKEKGITSLQNMLQHYQIAPHEQDRLDKTLNIIFGNITNLRQLTRFLNSVSLLINCFKDINLDISDLIALEYVKHFDIALYSYLSKNPRYLVSEDEDILNNYYDEYGIYNFYNKYNKRKNMNANNSNKISEQEKTKFDKLFGDDLSMLPLLSNVFPRLKIYYYEKNNQSLSIFGIEEDMSKSVLMSRCYNGRFFYSYFNNAPNYYIHLNKRIDKLINTINKTKSYKEEFNNLIYNEEYDELSLQLLFQLIDWRLNDIKDLDSLIDYLLSTYMKFENKFEILSNDLQKSIYIIFDSCIRNLKKLQQRKNFLDKIFKKDVRLLYQFLDTTLLIDPSTKNEEFWKYGKHLIVDQLNNLINNNFELYSKENYKLGFFHMFKNNNKEKEKVKKYFQRNINEDTIFRFIGDCLTHQTFNSYTLHFCNKEDIFNVVDDSTIQSVLDSINYCELNIDQKKVYNIYKEEVSQEASTDDSTKINFSNL